MLRRSCCRWDKRGAGNDDDDNSEDNSDGDDYVETGGRLRCSRSAAPVRVSTNTGGVAAELLQMQSSATISTIRDCRLGAPCGSRPTICPSNTQIRSAKLLSVLRNRWMPNHRKKPATATLTARSDR